MSVATQEKPPLAKVRAPKHVAIIMDGNRRWAAKRGLPLDAGHFEGAERLTEIVDFAPSLGIEVLTVYSFSTENWKRSQEEVDALMQLLKRYLLSQLDSMKKNSVRLGVIGDISKFPEDVRAIINRSIEETREGKKFDLVLALNYGGRNEIKRAIQDIVTDCMHGNLSKEELTEEVIARYLDTAKWKDPDLLIRTSGEHRISNFLLWQISYSEVYVSKTLWPDFSTKNLEEAVLEFQKREKRQGK